MTFTYNGMEFDYFDHPYNTTRLNERAVEIPIVMEWLSRQHGHGLEVGNVLSHYGVTGHHVVDLYEQAPGVQNIDLFDLRGPLFDWIVSISTIEHVRWDTPPQDPNGSAQAVQALLGMLRPGGSSQLLVTAPLGHQPYLDEAVRTGSLHPTHDSVMVLANGKDQWVQSDRHTWRAYGSETKWASAVWIAHWQV
jgi:hypothetical protein